MTAPKKKGKKKVAKTSSGKPKKKVSPPKTAKKAVKKKGLVKKTPVKKAPASKKTAKKTAKKVQAKKKAVKKAVKKKAPVKKKTPIKKKTTVKKKTIVGKKAPITTSPSIPKTETKSSVPEKKKKSLLTAAEVRRCKAQMLNKRAQIVGNITRMEDQALRSNKQEPSSDNMADYGTDNYEQDFTLGLIENVEATVQEIDEALKRISESKYGVCEGCQEPIPKPRLSVLPYAKFCVNCQSERESI